MAGTTDILKDMLSMLLARQGFQAPARIWRRSLASAGFSPVVFIKSLWWMSVLLERKQGLSLKNTNGEHIVYNYYLSLQYHLEGNYDEAVRLIKAMLDKIPGNAGARYLLADSLAASGDTEGAFNALKGLERREYTWIKLEGYVNNEQDFSRLEALYKDSLTSGAIDGRSAKTLECIALAAQKCGMYDRAIKIIDEIKDKGLTLKPNKSPGLNRRLAGSALRALYDICDSLGLKLFIVSGTLLGYIREGGFLEHDNDIDTGLFEGFDEKALIDRIRHSGVFLIIPRRSRYFLRIKHINGAAIDIFTHYTTGDDCWHGGVKVTWHNSKFGLKQIDYLGVPMYIPDNPQLYLEENYGKNYMQKVTNFDSATDCPNGKIDNEQEFRIYMMKKALQAH